MKDFADLDNSSGSFPDVIGVDASGPGETDGTELTADWFNDIFGFFQAILDDQGETPSGTAESASGTSQLLNCLKLSRFSPFIEIFSGFSSNASGASEWQFLVASGYMNSLANTGKIHYYIPVIRGKEQTIVLTISVKPGAARASGSRVQADFDTITPSGSPITDEDDGTTNTQDLVINTGAFTPGASDEYCLTISAGNTGAASPDRIYLISYAITLS